MNFAQDDNVVSRPDQDVVEYFPIFDTVIISEEMFGQEDNVKGWFHTFDSFRQKENHSFFTSRSRAEVSEAYNTQFSRDTQTEPYKIFSIGVEFFAPSTLGFGGWFTREGEPPTTWKVEEEAFAHWWRTVLPTECSLTFKTQQKTRLEVNALHAPPGYGITGAGLMYSGGTKPAQAFGVNAICQGVPIHTNRFQFEKFLDVAKNMQIEAIIGLSDYSREYMAEIWGPGQYRVPSLSPEPYFFSARYGIKVSLMGVRFTQQRGTPRR